MKTIERKNTARSMRLLGVLVLIGICGIAMAPAVAATVSPTSAAPDPWSGTWDTGASTPVADQTVGVLTLTRTGSTATGTFTNHDGGKGTITGTVTGNTLTGTWSMDYGYETDSGSFIFVLSDDKNTFTGTWVSAADKTVTLSITGDFWNGVRG